ncbi:MAG TPA: hypothetical protein VM912_18090 [Terriglobales bacterium]|nr:hypothetical protein [Terriglobales bacterium]
MLRGSVSPSLPRCLTTLQLVFAVVATAVLVGAGGFLLDWALLGSQRDLLYSDALAAAIAALLAFIALSHYNKRQQLALAQLQIIADVNHHVRNALTTVLYSVELTRDEPLIDMTRSAIARVDWALREVLPGENADGLKESLRDAQATELAREAKQWARTRTLKPIGKVKGNKAR